MTEDSLVSSTVVTTTSATTEPLADGVYAWRVCRLDEMEAALECSALREVEIDTVPPASPVPSSYADGAQVTDRTPTFSWRPVDGASEYHIQVYRHYAAAAGDKPVEADTLGPLVSSVTTETFYASGRACRWSLWLARARTGRGQQLECVERVPLFHAAAARVVADLSPCPGGAVGGQTVIAP